MLEKLSHLVVIFVTIVALSLISGLGFVSRSNCCRPCNRLKTKLHWNAYIRFTLMAYLQLLIVLLTTVGTDSFAESLTAELAILPLIFLPVIFGCLIYGYRERITEPQISQRMSSLYLSTRSNNIFQKMDRVVFLARRLLLASAVLVL